MPKEKLCEKTNEKKYLSAKNHSFLGRKKIFAYILRRNPFGFLVETMAPKSPFEIN